MREIRAAIGATTINPHLLTAAERIQYEGYLRREETGAAILALALGGTPSRRSSVATDIAVASFATCCAIGVRMSFAPARVRSKPIFRGRRGIDPHHNRPHAQARNRLLGPRPRPLPASFRGSPHAPAGAQPRTPRLHRGDPAGYARCVVTSDETTVPILQHRREFAAWSEQVSFSQVGRVGQKTV